mgnify:CR=1 FL=1
MKEINEIGNETAKTIHNFFNNKKNRKMIRKLLNQGINTHVKSTSASSRLYGKTIVFTGVLNDFTRDEAKEAIESLGGHATSSVSSNTDYVVVGKEPGKKLREAKEHDIEIIDDFLLGCFFHFLSSEFQNEIRNNNMSS